MANNIVPKGKYTMPAIALTATGIGSFLSAPVATTATLAGATAGSKAADTGMKFATGKTWAQYVNKNGFPLTKGMGKGLNTEAAELTNPGMIAGGVYGGWVGNNFKNLGRYTLNYLNPRAYGNYAARLKDVYTKPFYTKPPTFHNGKKPTWYTGATDDEIRFQNGAIWAGISEKEIPRTLIQKNSDGKTYRWTRQALENGIYGKNGIDLVGEDGLSNQKVIDKALEKQANGETLQDMDYFTTVGGEHSDYKVLYDNPNGVLWELQDEQKLNPQWIISDKLKEILHLKKGTVPHKIIDKIGGYNASSLLGYKPFTYRQGIGVLKDGSNRTFYFDPTHWESTGIIKPE